jgi:hypothetical protein
MHNLLLLHCQVALRNVSDNMQCLKIGQSALTLDVLLEIAVLAVLGHDVDVVFGHKDLNGTEDVRVGESSESIDLVVK